MTALPQLAPLPEAEGFNAAENYPFLLTPVPSPLHPVARPRTRAPRSPKPTQAGRGIVHAKIDQQQWSLVLPEQRAAATKARNRRIAEFRAKYYKHFLPPADWQIDVLQAMRAVESQIAINPDDILLQHEINNLKVEAYTGFQPYLSNAANVIWRTKGQPAGEQGRQDMHSRAKQAFFQLLPKWHPPLPLMRLLACELSHELKNYAELLRADTSSPYRLNRHFCTDAKRLAKATAKGPKARARLIAKKHWLKNKVDRLDQHNTHPRRTTIPLNPTTARNRDEFKQEWHRHAFLECAPQGPRQLELGEAIAAVATIAQKKLMPQERFILALSAGLPLLTPEQIGEVKTREGVTVDVPHIIQKFRKDPLPLSTSFREIAEHIQYSREMIRQKFAHILLVIRREFARLGFDVTLLTHYADASATAYIS